MDILLAIYALLGAILILGLVFIFLIWYYTKIYKADSALSQFMAKHAGKLFLGGALVASFIILPIVVIIKRDNFTHTDGCIILLTFILYELAVILLSPSGRKNWNWKTKEFWEE